MRAKILLLNDDVEIKMAVVNTIYCFPSSRIIFDEYNIG